LGASSTISLVPVPGEDLQLIGGSTYRHFAGGGVEEDYEKYVLGFSPWGCVVRSFSNNGKGRQHYHYTEHDLGDWL
jgi:hypothetical protein